MRARFVVFGVTGYPEGPMSAAARPRTSYSVADAAYNYREVARFYVTQGGRLTDADRLTLAKAEAARLNEWDAAQ